MNLITKDNYSTEALLAIFEAAFFNCSIDKDGDLLVCSEYRVMVKGNGLFVQLITIFTAQKGASRLALLEAINKMNMDLSVPRAYALTDGFDHALVLDYNVTIGDGLSPRSLIESFRFYETCVRRAISFFDGLLN